MLRYHAPGQRITKGTGARANALIKQRLSSPRRASRGSSLNSNEASGVREEAKRQDCWTELTVGRRFRESDSGRRGGRQHHSSDRRRWNEAGGRGELRGRSPGSPLSLKGDPGG
ncbi:hypothetical protein DPEC_G00235880 [Dallia pectoralis]|uniref:Uncharacterized protein n=1 Tax=Dallia pectoralis TaxID=75939 RepID=A0ACC2FYD8_DALPE|nr:hypothetical protein DPEC_G00235880 [Dallia pectoralis]